MPGPRLGIGLCILAFAVCILACTSNDTLFIHLTPTPMPSPVPTPLSENTHFKVGQMVTLVNAEFDVSLYTKPGSTAALDTAKQRCPHDTIVKILDIQHSAIDPSDPVNQYRIQCTVAVGWVPEYELTALQKNQQMFVSTADQRGASLYSSADTASNVIATCPENSKVTILGFSSNAARFTTDRRIYVSVLCNRVTGYLLEENLKTAAQISQEF